MKRQNTAHVYYRFLLVIYGIMDAVFAALFAGILFPLKAAGSDVSPILVLVLIVILCLGVPTVWSLSMFLHYRRVVPTDVQKVELTKTVTTYLRRVGFTVTVTQNGEALTVTTPCVFSAGVFGVNLLDEYSGKTVEIGHDEKWDEWIVLCLDEPERPF